MRKILLILLLLLLQTTAWALNIEITEGVEDALPIAIVPFASPSGAAMQPGQSIDQVITADLAGSGRFKALDTADMLSRPAAGDAVDFRDWRALNMENLVVGRVEANGPGGYLVRFLLYDVYRGEQIIGYNIPTTAQDLRATAHHIADLIYETLTGTPGAFSTRIAYVTSVGARESNRVAIQIADADGYNEQTIVSSSDPLMSPAWSPDGRKLAYVSFENRKSSIWIQEVFSGAREKVASFKGINGAPAFSPDGRYLAMTLSKDGSPDIYVMDLARRQTRAVVKHWGIDTEPAWSPDGRYIVFTSDRGGAPQIYRVPVAGGEAKRLTFDGSYNARASYSADGKSLALITRRNGQYRIGVLDLGSGSMNVLSEGKLDESPSFAPNGSMIIYATRAEGKGVLAAVSTDGRVRQRLALKAGDVRDPVWSPSNKRKRSE
jgi:TolB protein